MAEFNEDPKPVTRHLVPEDQEMGAAEDIFGDLFFLRLEPMIYEIVEQIAPDYRKQFWRYFKLSNGGLYLKPEEDRVYAVSCANGFHGDLSSDALGITACLSVYYSHCSFSQDERFGSKCGDHYHLLRSYMMDHAEAAQMTSSCREFSRGTYWPCSM